MKISSHLAFVAAIFVFITLMVVYGMNIVSSFQEHGIFDFTDLMMSAIGLIGSIVVAYSYIAIIKTRSDK